MLPEAGMKYTVFRKIAAIYRQQVTVKIPNNQFFD